MIGLLCFALAVLASPFKSNSRLEAENAALRHQLIVLGRKVRGRAQLTNSDRWFFIQLYRWFPSIVEALTIIRPETLGAYWIPINGLWWRVPEKAIIRNAGNPLGEAVVWYVSLRGNIEIRCFVPADAS